MTTGGLIAGFTVAILAGVVARTTELKEDASLATFYLVSLALGVTIVSIKGTNIDLLHVLFGNILAMDDQTLLVIAFNATITLLVLAVIYRPLVIECVDPVFLRTVSRAGAPAHLAFLALVVINLVNGFHALGTLLAVGLMILPAGIARFWSRDITGMICIAVASAMVSGYAGLVLSFQTKIPSGPAIILVAAGIYVVSVLFGNVSGLVRQLFPAPPSGGMRRCSGCSWLIVSGARIAPRPFPRSAQERLNVVASFSILGDFVRNVGGDRVNVTTLVGPERRRPCLFADAGRCEKDRRRQTDFRQRPRLRRLAAAAGESAGSKATARDGDRRASRRSSSARDADPHAWQSVANAKIYVANISDALAAADPASPQAFRANAEAYLAKLDALDREVREAIAKIPEGRRKVISTHDAFGYFAAAYGIEFIAPVGVSTESEPSARDIAGIITQIKSAKIPAVFLENVSDPRLIRRISAETGAKVGGTLYSDSLTDEKGDAPTYIDMVRHNIKALTSALGELGQGPPCWPARREYPAPELLCLN